MCQPRHLPGNPNIYIPDRVYNNLIGRKAQVLIVSEYGDADEEYSDRVCCNGEAGREKVRKSGARQNFDSPALLA